MRATATSSSLVTLGYEGRSAGELVALMVGAGVSVVADVRLTPLSRKPGLSKRALSEQLAAADIRYVHLRGLGNPKDNRDGFRRGETDSRDRFRAVLGTDAGQDGLEQVRALMGQGHTVALLCFEHNPATCHRSLVAHELLRAGPHTGVVEL
jgi:uncharacterized protein (DUF488 family)